MREDKVETKVESKIEKWSRECLAQGFMFINKVDYYNSLCECQKCDHQDVYQQTHMRNGNVACSNCQLEKWSSECLARGFTFIEKAYKNNSLCECQVCGHQDVYHQANMRNGEVACSNCQLEKWSSECLARGFTFIEKAYKNYSLCECQVCGHQDVYVQSAMRKGEVSCSNCSPGHWNEPSWFYITRITPINAEPFIKVGISNNPTQRYTQYGLQDGTILEELTKVLFQTKLEAVGYESAVIKFLEPYHIDPEEEKTILTKSGWTECFTMDALNHLLDDRGFHQLSLTTE